MTTPSPLSDSLQEIPPTGMLTAGTVLADAISSLAQRQLGVPGWEAFHYERMSATEFEITGGIADSQTGVKKWSGTHETVVLAEANIVQEMQSLLAIEGIAATRKADSGVASTALPAAPTVVPRSSSLAPPKQYLSVVLELPELPEDRHRVLEAFRLQAEVLGATVQSCSLHDRFSVSFG